MYIYNIYNIYIYDLYSVFVFFPIWFYSSIQYTYPKRYLHCRGPWLERSCKGGSLPSVEFLAVGRHGLGDPRDLVEVSGDDRWDTLRYLGISWDMAIQARKDHKSGDMIQKLWFNMVQWLNCGSIRFFWQGPQMVMFDCWRLFSKIETLIDFGHFADLKLVPLLMRLNFSHNIGSAEIKLLAVPT